MRIGYARVSSSSQNLDNQLTRLGENGCEKVFKEKYSGAKASSRKQLQNALEFVREGDSLVVTKLCRLARSAVDLGNIAEKLTEKKVDLVVLDQDIDTSSSTGKLMFNMIAAFSQFERDLIRERCAEGILAAKEKGIQFGRRSKLSDSKLSELKQDFAAGELTRKALCEKYGISRASLYRLAGS